MPPEGVAGVILAGGLSRRMGGGDKCLRSLGGKPILAHIIERVRPQVETLILNANGDPARFDAFGLPVVADVISGAVLPAGDVLLLDDTGDWRGIGTALLLQQLRCRVGLVTADAMVAARLTPAAGGAEARRRFARSGGVDFVHTVVTAWDGTAGRATMRQVLTDRVDAVGADWLVVAEPPTAPTTVADQMAKACPHAAVHVIGDALAPRHAAAAIAEAHALALAL